MLIKRILNNNIVVTENSNGVEQVVCGRGIAYNKRIGSEIDESLINQVFVLKSENKNKRFQEIIANIPLEYIELADQIIDLIKIELGKKVNDTIYISLSDHLSTAIERAKEGVYITNTMLWEIQHYYGVEFAIAKKVLRVIEDSIGVKLKEDEAGFIALHIVNSEAEASELEGTVRMTKIIQDVTSMVRMYFSMNFNTDSVYYYRFISHLKFFAQRVVNQTPYNGGSDDSLLDVIKIKYASAYKCSEKISDMIRKGYQFDLSDEEKMYLTIHIHRIVNVSADNE